MTLYERRLREDLVQRVLPIPEDPLNIPAHHTRGHPRSPRQVLDVVVYTRGAAGTLKAVLVAPPQVRARHLAIDPESALSRGNVKFRRRFAAVEGLCHDRGLQLESLGLAQLDALWDEVKAGERPG